MLVNPRKALNDLCKSHPEVVTLGDNFVGSHPEVVGLADNFKSVSVNSLRKLHKVHASLLCEVSWDPT